MSDPLVITYNSLNDLDPAKMQWTEWNKVEEDLLEINGFNEFLVIKKNGKIDFCSYKDGFPYIPSDEIWYYHLLSDLPLPAPVIKMQEFEKIKELAQRFGGVIVNMNGDIIIEVHRTASSSTIVSEPYLVTGREPEE